MSIARARALIAVGRWAQAEEALRPVLADPSVGADAWCLLAQCRLESGDQRGALDAASRALSVDPDQEWPYRLRALALIRSSRSKVRAGQALAAARRAVSLAPESPFALYTLTLVLAQDRRRLADAWCVAQDNLRANPRSTIAFCGACLVELTRRRWVEAERYARDGLALDPPHRDLLRYLGRAHSGQGRAREAADLYAASALRDPVSGEARAAFGDLGSPVVVRHFTWRNWARLAVLLVVAWPVVVPALLMRSVVGWVRHLRARAALPPDQRRIAVEERRQARAPAIAAFALGSALATFWAAVTVHVGAALGWLVLTMAAGYLWGRWRARPGWVERTWTQSIRNRFR